MDVTDPARAEKMGRKQQERRQLEVKCRWRRLSVFPGDEVDDQVSVQGPLYLSYMLFDLDGSKGEK